MLRRLCAMPTASSANVSRLWRRLFEKKGVHLLLIVWRSGWSCGRGGKDNLAPTRGATTFQKLTPSPLNGTLVSTVRLEQIYEKRTIKLVCARGTSAAGCSFFE